MSLIAELKRRNVFKVGVAYVVAAWLILQLTEVLTELLDLQTDIGKIVIVLLVVGFVPALIFAWAFELTPEGVKREKDVDRGESIAPKTGRKLDRIIICMLALGMAYFFWESRIADTTEQASKPGFEERKPNLVRENKRGKSIAVLPFTNRSPNPDDIYFTDGVHDDLLTQLAKIDTFSVISRTSVMEYRDTSKNLKKIASELGVANVMEGAVQRAGNRVRINVQLIAAETDEHLWAEVYDRELTTENLFDIQSEIAKAIAKALQATLTDSEMAIIADVPTQNIAAYELYMQARRFAFGDTKIGYDTALELYEEALRLEPGFKLAWIGMAEAHLTNYWQYGGKLADRQNARDAIDRARAIDPDFPELYLAEGFYWYWGHLDYDRAITNLKKAIDQMPGNAAAHMWLGWASRRDGQWENAVNSMQKALRLDPRVLIHWVEFSRTLGMLDRNEEALAAAETSRDLAPDSYWPKLVLSEQLLRSAGDIDRAVSLMVGAQYTGDGGFIFSYIRLHVLARDFDEALEAVNEITDEMEISRTGFDLRERLTAQILQRAGRNEEARNAARSALARMKALEASIPRDYRYPEAESRLYAILAEPEKVSRLVTETLESKPTDAVEDGYIRYSAAKSLAIAGLHQEAFEQLDIVLSNPGFNRPMVVSVDPAFDDVRNAPEFIALMEKHR
jgi:TolB-like protein/Flp pilus assembly protein TadD